MSALMQGGSALARSEEHWSMCFESPGSPTVGDGQARSTLWPPFQNIEVVHRALLQRPSWDLSARFRRPGANARPLSLASR
jgi:hypothetical protein